MAKDFCLSFSKHPKISKRDTQYKHSKGGGLLVCVNNGKNGSEKMILMNFSMKLKRLWLLETFEKILNLQKFY